MSICHPGCLFVAGELFLVDYSTPTPGGQPAALPRGAAWGLRDILYGLALPAGLWGLFFGLSFVLEPAEEEPIDEAAIIAGLVFALVLDAIFVALAVGFSLWKYRLKWSALGLRSLHVDLVWVPVVAAISAYVAVVAYTAVMTAAGPDALAPEQEELEDLFESRAILPLTGVVTVLAAPFAEEVFFRGFVFGGLRERVGVAWAAILSGLLFGAFHISDADTAGLIIPFGAIGILFAWIYHRTGSLWAPMSAHFLFNLISFILLAAVVGSE